MQQPMHLLHHSQIKGCTPEPAPGIDDDIWIRFLYGHPEHFEETLLDVVSNQANVCSYFDIPIQHVDSSILKAMGRHYTESDLYRLFEAIRNPLPEAALRTSVIVGFPGETDAHVERLLRFIQSVRFHHLGVFTYSDSQDLPSHRLPDHVPEAVAAERMALIMNCQKQISLVHNQAYVGTTVRALVEEKLEDNLFAARCTFQAPEVDGLTFIHKTTGGPAVTVGDFALVSITDAMEYDIVGECIE